MFCSKCGKQLPENTKFCSGCGTATSQSDTNSTDPQQASSDSAVAAVAQLSEKFSLSPMLLCVCAGMALVFVYYFFRYLGSWSLTFWSLLSSLVTPALFVGLILTKAKDKSNHMLFIIPFALRGFVSLISLLRALDTMPLLGWLTNLAHISLATLFILTILGKFNAKKTMMIIGIISAVVLGVISFRGGFFNGMVQIIYFASVSVLLREIDITAKRNT